MQLLLAVNAMQPVFHVQTVVQIVVLHAVIFHRLFTISKLEQLFAVQLVPTVSTSVLPSQTSAKNVLPTV